MVNIDKELDRYLSLLRNKIRESGFIQMEIQERLGWGRSYISQLLTKQKALRLEQVLLILKVIGVEPGEFFKELYGEPPRRGISEQRRLTLTAESRGSRGPHEVAGMKALAKGLTDVLIRKGLITADGLAEAMRKAGIIRLAMMPDRLQWP